MAVRQDLSDLGDLGEVVTESRDQVGPQSFWMVWTMTGWWFGTMEFYDFPYIGNNNPNWLILFFRGVGILPTRWRSSNKIHQKINDFKTTQGHLETHVRSSWGRWRKLQFEVGSQFFYFQMTSCGTAEVRPAATSSRGGSSPWGHYLVVRGVAPGVSWKMWI